jgi:hypothetical protein
VTWTAGMLASAWRKAWTICSSVNQLFFMAVLPFGLVRNRNPNLLVGPRFEEPVTQLLAPHSCIEELVGYAHRRSRLGRHTLALDCPSHAGSFVGQLQRV